MLSSAVACSTNGARGEGGKEVLRSRSDPPLKGFDACSNPERYRPCFADPFNDLLQSKRRRAALVRAEVGPLAAEDAGQSWLDVVLFEWCIPSR